MNDTYLYPQSLLEALASEKKLSVGFSKLNADEIFYLLQISLHSVKHDFPNVLADNIFALIQELGKKKSLWMLFADENLFSLTLNKIGDQQIIDFLMENYLEYLEERLGVNVNISPAQIEQILGSKNNKFYFAKSILYRKYKSLDKKSAKVFASIYDFERLKDSNRELEKQIFDQSKELQKLNEENTVQVKEIKAFNSEMSDLREKLNQCQVIERGLQARNNSLSTQNKELDEALNEEKRKSKTQNKEIVKLNSDLATLRPELDRLQKNEKDFVVLRETINSLNQEVLSLRTQNERLNKEQTRVRDENDRLKQQLNEGSSVIEKNLRKEIDVLNLENLKKQNSLDNKEAEISNLKKSLSAEIAKLQEEINSKVDLVNSKTQKNNLLEQELISANKKIEALKQEIMYGVKSSEYKTYFWVMLVGFLIIYVFILLVAAGIISISFLYRFV